jgi:integrase
VPTVVQLPTGKALTVRAAADAFLDSLRNPNTVRSYSTGVGKTVERIGEARPLGSVADDEIGEALELLWGTAAVNTWNARRASVLSWLGWCEEYGYDGPSVPAWTKRLAVPDSETPARSKMAVDRLIARREVHLREKTLWRMLYETVARVEEILGVNIEELDLAGRRAPVKAKGARPRTRRRGAVREDFVSETVYWDAGTARLLPTYSKAVRAGGVRHPAQARPWQGGQPARHLPGHRARPPLLRAGPDVAGRAHGPRR